MSSTQTVLESSEVQISNLKAPLELPVFVPPPVTKENIEWADILTVDLSKYDTDRAELVDTVRTALERDGFFYVVGHGISPTTINRQLALAQIAFDDVSREEKERHVAPIKEEGTFRGYKLQNYWEISNGIRDRIEQYNFYLNEIDPATRHPKALQPHVEEIKAFIEESRTRVLKKVTTLIDGVLGLPEGTLWRLHETEDGIKGGDLYRYMVYDPLTSEEAKGTNGVMLAGHTDFGSISCLVSQPITALQVLMPDNVWRYVKHHDNAYVINIGDQVSFMSGGILKATMHRVVRPPQDQRHLRRLGLFHFAHLLDGVPLDLFPTEKVQKEGHKIFNDVIPTSDEWERARVKTYGVGEFIKGDEYDIEILNGIQIRHYR
ncbi:Clavaminate synthase-like protein [Pholiota conissans]|uniref:Clavaminate synthase-like protein n=1 Tax=Pholiota conissans TaxID=109636 RepID=A0A9P5ZH26_9AGAR|nr:Clavaminate synthase-like protein [Pholiota conissans]